VKRRLGVRREGVAYEGDNAEAMFLASGAGRRRPGARLHTQKSGFGLSSESYRTQAPAFGAKISYLCLISSFSEVTERPSAVWKVT
jgi:hypothetical protein